MKLIKTGSLVDSKRPTPKFNQAIIVDQFRDFYLYGDLDIYTFGFILEEHVRRKQKENIFYNSNYIKELIIK